MAGRRHPRRLLLSRAHGHHPAPPPQATPDPAVVELSYWDSVKESGDLAQLQSYRDQYPQGRFVQLAELKIRALKKASEPPPAERPKPAPEPPASEGNAYREPKSGMEFVRIEGGSFQMGSPSGEEGRYEDEKQHRVSVGDFWLAKHEVTNGQYRKFKPGHDSGEGDNLPVVDVDWSDATAYAGWLSQQTGKTYRLPAEAEWEYACRAGGQDLYCGGNDLDALAWHSGNSGVKTHPVGGKQANGWGLSDMSGNVWEWTCSAYDKDYGGSEKQCSGKNDASGYRALRGGSWYDKPGYVRSAERSFWAPDFRGNLIGFRLLQD
ncbi:MAG: formylglycine-generating enzyme family protein [Gammaproteobacteria bacterium]|nr:formylglycine-generating enzyme family protein [Gammaproteobacteria bacterium]MBU1961529.1 formylglycine-generating enzyme family protein [Gammaproteobacteria bacterium]